MREDGFVWPPIEPTSALMTERVSLMAILLRFFRSMSLASAKRLRAGAARDRRHRLLNVSDREGLRVRRCEPVSKIWRPGQHCHRPTGGCDVHSPMPAFFNPLRRYRVSESCRNGVTCRTQRMASVGLTGRPAAIL